MGEVRGIEEESLSECVFKEEPRERPDELGSVCKKKVNK